MKPTHRVIGGLVLTGLAVAGWTGFGWTNSGSAWAQKPPLQEMQLPPLQRQGSPPVGQVPGPFIGPSQNYRSQTNNGSNAVGSPAASTQFAPTPAAPTTTTERSNLWVPAGVAKLQALDKVNAQASDLTVKVGQSVTFGSLTITVKSCMVRPPDQPPDAAVYLDIADSHSNSPGFDGWMLRGEPSMSMMEHPIYDLRVTGCT